MTNPDSQFETNATPAWHSRFRSLPPEYRDELLAIRAEGAGARFLPQAHVLEPVLGTALTAAILAAWFFYGYVCYHWGELWERGHLRVAFFSVAAVFAARWPFSLWHFARGHGFALTSFGLVEWAGGWVSVYPWGTLKNLGVTGGGSVNLTHYDPTTGRTRFFITPAERWQRAVHDKLPGFRPLKTEIKSYTWNLAVPGLKEPVRIFFASGNSDAGLEFSRTFDEMNKKAVAPPPVATRPGRRKTAMQIFWRLSPAAALIAAAWFLVFAVPSHNLAVHDDWADVYLFEGDSPTARSLTENLHELETYVNRFPGYRYHAMAKERFIALLTAKISTLRGKMLSSPDGTSPDKGWAQHLMGLHAHHVPDSPYGAEREILYRDAGQTITSWKEYVEAKGER